jgi:branched-chain amino acid transport system ATP-binding protein/branched-chain amino acid transport system permease protein
VSGAWQYYFATLFVYFGVNAIACWALNLQYGVSGVLNFAFIMYQAIGAYAAAVVTLGPSSTGGYSFQTYVVGWSLPWPLSLIAAAVVGGALSLAVGLFAFRPARRDYQAMVMLVVSIIAATLVVSQPHWLNGAYGLAAIPKPFASLGLNLYDYGWFYVGLTAAVAALVYLLVHLMTSSPWGRRLRAMRENPDALEALGGDVGRESLKVYVIGGALAGLSGGLLAEFIGAWSPSSWGTDETFLYFVAIIVGGAGNNFGAMLGAATVLGIFQEGVRFLPSVGYANISEAVQFAILGVLILLFLWFRPIGIVPERRRRFGVSPVLATATGPPLGVVAPAPPSVSVAAPPARRAPSAGNILEVSDLRCEFRGVHAVDGVSFAAARGLATGLIGPNGAGKSTALKVIAGAQKPSGGRVIYEGDDITGLPAHAIARRGLVRTFQLSSEFGRLTVMENLLAAVPAQRGGTFAGSLLGRRYWRGQQAESVERARELCDRFGMSAQVDDYAGRLSGGQKRLVEIMRALMARPTMLLLDEPLAGVNPTLRLTIEGHIMALRDEGLTIVMVEHELRSVERVCDAVIVMAQGRVLASGTMEELRQNQDVVDAYLVG